MTVSLKSKVYFPHSVDSSRKLLSLLYNVHFLTPSPRFTATQYSFGNLRGYPKSDLALHVDVLARKAYPTDLTDAQWRILTPLIPASKHGGRSRKVNMREVVNTIFHLNRAGCQMGNASARSPSQEYPVYAKTGLGTVRTMVGGRRPALSELPPTLLPLRLLLRRSLDRVEDRDDAGEMLLQLRAIGGRRA